MSVIILKALADETRLSIIDELLKGEKNVSKLVSLINKSQPNISLSLNKLFLAGILEKRQKGKEVFFYIKNPQKIRKILELINDE